MKSAKDCTAKELRSDPEDQSVFFALNGCIK
jgi:hypothetical protein